MGDDGWGGTIGSGTKCDMVSVLLFVAIAVIVVMMIRKRRNQA